MSWREAQSGHGGLCFRATREKKILWGRLGVSASVPCPGGMESPAAPQTEAWGLCGSIECMCVDSVHKEARACVCTQMRVLSGMGVL